MSLRGGTHRGGERREVRVGLVGDWTTWFHVCALTTTAPRVTWLIALQQQQQRRGSSTQGSSTQGPLLRTQTHAGTWRQRGSGLQPCSHRCHWPNVPSPGAAALPDLSPPTKPASSAPGCGGGGVVHDSSSAAAAPPKLRAIWRGRRRRRGRARRRAQVLETIPHSGGVLHGGAAGSAGNAQACVQRGAECRSPSPTRPCAFVDTWRRPSPNVCFHPTCPTATRRGTAQHSTAQHGTHRVALLPHRHLQLSFRLRHRVGLQEDTRRRQEVSARTEERRRGQTERLAGPGQLAFAPHQGSHRHGRKAACTIQRSMVAWRQHPAAATYHQQTLPCTVELHTALYQL